MSAAPSTSIAKSGILEKFLGTSNYNVLLAVSANILSWIVATFMPSKIPLLLPDIPQEEKKEKYMKTKQHKSLVLRPCSSPTSPSRRTTSCKGRLVNSSFRESFKKVKTGERENCELSKTSQRRPSVVQHELNKQKPKLDTKLYPNYTDMPRMWAEVSDTQKQ